MNRTFVVGAAIAALATIAFIAPRLLRGDASGALVGLAVLGGIIALHRVEVSVDAHLNRRREARTVAGIRELIAMASSTNASERGARRTFRKIATKDRLQPVLLDEPGLEQAAGAPGPHQVHLLRLILVHLWPNTEPWQSLIAAGEQLLLEGEVSERELSFLQSWREARQLDSDS